MAELPRLSWAPQSRRRQPRTLHSKADSPLERYPSSLAPHPSSSNRRRFRGNESQAPAALVDRVRDQRFATLERRAHTAHIDRGSLMTEAKRALLVYEVDANRLY